MQEYSLQFQERPHEKDILEMFSYQNDEELTILHTCQVQLVSTKYMHSSFKDRDIPVYVVYEEDDNELHDERFISIFEN